VHAHGAYDPHTWLDPVLAQDMVREITTALVAQFPEQEAALEENARVLIADLATLDTTYRGRLSSCTVDEAFISHDAAGYLARRYDLSFHAIAGLSTEDEPSAKLLNDLSREADDKRAILAEQGTVTAYAETLSRETGLAIVPFNPLGRGPLEEGAVYFDVMERNLESLAVAFACDTI
jgi:zinc transport system substrate-binding protein